MSTHEERRSQQTPRFGARNELATLWLAVVAGVALTLAGGALASEHEAEPPAPPAPPVAVEGVLVADGLDSPIALADPADGTGRLFVADQAGRVYVIDAEGELLDEPLLDISDRLAPRREEGLEERGLLGLALHPDFERNGWFYVLYSAPLRSGAPADWDHTRRVSEFKISAADPDRANHDSERVVLSQDWPTHKHNGGGLAFGPDGYLYIGFGDGGGVHGIGDRPDYVDADDLDDADRWWPVWHHWDHLAQDTTSLFGKVLRIDVDRGFPAYHVPATNPFVGREGRDEIYAWGFRQPFGLAFDPGGQHGLFVSNTGHFIVEAIYLVNRPGNYGWPLKEGTRCFDAREGVEPEVCPTTGPEGEGLIDPVAEYEHRRIGGFGTAIVGGRVYRGTSIPELDGALVIGDWGTGLHVARPTDRVGAAWPVDPLLEIDGYVLGVAQDAQGEVYVLSNQVVGLGETTGAVHRLVAATPATAEAVDDDAVRPETPPDAPLFGEEQVERGRVAYRRHCASCHGADMEGEAHFPPLAGEQFQDRWEGRTVWDLYHYTSTTMPLGAGGTLAEETYADIVARILERNTYEAGEDALLEPEQDLLDLVVLDFD